MRQTMGQRGVNGVFGDIAFDAIVVVLVVVFWQCAALHFHFVRGLPRANHHFAHSPHRLAVAAHHRQRAQVLQNIFGGNGFAPDAAFGKRHIFGNGGIKVMTDHQHVEVFINGVDGVWPCRIG